MRSVRWGLAAVCAVGLLCAAHPVGAAPASAAQPGAVAQLAGNVLVPAGTTMQGGVNMVAGQVEVDGTLSGTVALSLGQVTVGPQGLIDGGVSVALGQVSVAPGGRIAGPVHAGGARVDALRCPASASTDCTLEAVPTGWVRPGRAVTAAGPGPWKATVSRLLHWPRWVLPTIHILGWLGLLAVALPLAALFPRALSQVTGRMETDPWRSLLVGFGALVLALPALVLITITIIGIPVALAALLGLVAAWFFGYVGVASLVGRRTLGLGGWSGANPLLALLVGAALLLVAGWVPVVGGLVRVVAACLGVGAVLLSRFGTGGGRPGGAVAAPPPAPGPGGPPPA